MIFNYAASGSLARGTIFFPPHIVVARNIVVAVNHNVTLSLPLQRCLIESALLPSLKTYDRLSLIDGSTLEMSRTPLTCVLDSPRVRSAKLSKIIPTPSSIDTSTAPAPIHNKSNSQRKFQTNCTECTQAHHHCVFHSLGNLECTHCLKMHLFCTFCDSDMTISLFSYFPFLF